MFATVDWLGLRSLINVVEAEKNTRRIWLHFHSKTQTPNDDILSLEIQIIRRFVFTERAFTQHSS